MGKFDKLNKELVRVNNAQGGPNAAALDDRFQLLNNTLVNTQQEWEDYVARRQQEQEALDEYSHGRGNRSYLREDYGTGSYTEGMDAVKRRRQQQEWEKANADYEAALQEYNKAAETTRRVSAVAGPMSPEKQREINAAKSTEQSLKERLDALKATADKLKVNDSGFTDWEGRDALVEEYRQLQTELEHQSRRSPERMARFDEVKRQLQEGDRAAGNGAADYSLRDRSASIFGGTAKRVAGGLANTALTAVDLAVKYNPYLDAVRAVNNRFGTVSANPIQYRQGMDKLYAAADRISNSAAADIERAKNGLGKLGQAGVDIAENVLEMGFDAAVGVASGGGSLVSMFARVFGDSAREARQAGATLEQQVGYGVAGGDIEVLTEKLFDGVAGIYGKGAADNITETVVRRLSSTPTGQTMLRGLIGAINEGNEEVLSDLLNPLAQTIYRDESLGQLYREIDPAEVVYDFLLGAAVGGLGSVTSAVTGQDAAKNAQNEYVSQLYEQSGERPSFGREVRDRAILERQWANPDAYNAANLSVEENAQEAMRALRGRQTETARAQELQQTQREMTRQNAEANVPAFFSASGITLDDNQRGRLMGTLNDNDISAKNFAIGTRDAYNMGEQGATMEETVQAMGEKYGLSPKQARTAWSFGASNAQTTATGTADVSTEEGRTQVESALSFLGERAAEAVKLYDSRQDVGRMATAMNKAVLYAAHSADVQETVQNAREGKAADVVGVLTDEQARLAQEIGNEKRARQQAADKALGESYREMRKRAAAITGTTTVSAQALEAVDTAIDVTRKAGQRVMDEFNTLYNALEALEKADPNAKNSEPYKEMLERAYKLRDKAQEAQKQIRELEKRKAQIEGRKTIQRKKGTVSFGGGTIEGVKYDGVDPEKLTRQQQKVVAMVERLADAVNLDYVFISADPGMGGAYTFGGRVYININAGLGVGDFSQTMAAASLSHEMTHWMQQYAPEEYSQLKDFIVQEILKADPQKLQTLIQQQKEWEKGRALTDEQALDEVVANACQTMLLDSKAINKLARQNMTLTARIADWIADWSEKVKAAFQEVDTSRGAIYEAVRTLDGSLEHIQELWDNGIEAALENYNAAFSVTAAIGGDSSPSGGAKSEAKQNAAQNIGGAKYQIIYPTFTEEEMQENSRNLRKADIVKTLTGNEFSDHSKSLFENVVAFFDSIGNNVHSDVFGDVALTRSSARSEIRHGTTRAKTVAYAALPEVIQNGKTIYRIDKGGGLERIVVAAPIQISQTKYYMAVMLQRDPTSQRLYAHDVVIAEESTSSADRHLSTNRAGSGGDKLFITDILQNALSVKEKSEFEDLPERKPQKEDWSGTNYQKWDDTAGDTAAESNGRAEAYTRIASENAALKETVEALQKLTKKQGGTIARLQKRLSLTKTQEVRESDARKMARRLTKEYSSRADKAEIADALKSLGDYILQTEQVDAEEVKERARQIAAQIVDEAREQARLEDSTMQEVKSRVKDAKLMIDPKFLGELDQEGGYNAVRQRYFNTTLKKRSFSTADDGYTSVSQFYADIQSEYGKGYFPDLANEGEELLAIAAAIRAAAPVEVNPFAQYRGEAIESLANAIAMETMEGALRPTPRINTDHAQGAIEQLREKIRELEKENAQEARELGKDLTDLTEALEKAENRYRSLLANAEMRVEQVRAEGKSKQTQAKLKERARGEKKLEGIQDYYRDLDQWASARRIEAAMTTRYRNNIGQKAERLRNLITHSDARKNVPESLRGPIRDMLETLELNKGPEKSAAQMTREEELEWQKRDMLDASFGERMLRLGQAIDEQESLGSLFDVSAEIREFVREIGKEATQAQEEGRELRFSDLLPQELKMFNKFLENMAKAIDNMNSFLANDRFSRVQDAADNDIRHMQELGKASEGEQGKLLGLAAWKGVTPYYAMRRYGEGGKAIFEALTKGWEKMAFNAREVIDFAEKAYTPEEVRAWQKETHEIELSDGSETPVKVTVTTAQIMELAMLLGREQAVKHIERGGIRFGDVKTKKGVRGSADRYHMGVEDLQAVTRLLTERQLEVAKTLQQYMAKKGAEWGNEISMRRWGYNFYDEGPGYYPIKTSSTERPMADTDAQKNSMFRLLNISASKAIDPRASNSLIVGDIFDTFAEHMADMAKLNGLGLPILDAIKWFSYKERIDLGDGMYDVRTTQDAMKNAFGDEALNYFKTLMKDINGETENGDRGTGWDSKLMSNYKAAAVGANLRVAALQPTSYVRASYRVKPQYLLKAFTNKNAYKEMMQYSGTGVWKDIGGVDTNLARGMRDQIRHDESWKDKLVEKSMALAELGDRKTWGRLWVACKMQTAAETGLQGEELKKKTADLFREVIYSSQVMDSTLTRSELMRGNTKASKAMTAFMAEPTLSYSMVIDAAMEARMNMRQYGGKEGFKRSGGYLMRAFAVYTSSAAFSAIVESLADAFRDDDDYESFLQKWAQAMFGEGNLFSGNLVQDLTLIGKIPWLKPYISRLQGYKNKDMGTAALDDVFAAYNIWKETIELQRGILEKPTKVTYYGNMTTWGKIYKTLQALSNGIGLPAANLTRDVAAVYNTLAAPLTGKKIKTYDAGEVKAIQDAVAGGYMSGEKAEKLLLEKGLAKDENDAYWTARGFEGEDKYTQIKAGAFHGEDGVYQHELEQLTSHGISEKDASSQIRSFVKKVFTGAELSKNERMVAGGQELTAQEAQDILTRYCGMDENEAYLTVKSWESGDDGKYTGALRAAFNGDQTAFKAETQDLTGHGVKAKDIESQVKSLVKDVYLGHELSEAKAEISGGKSLTDAEARKLLHYYAGMSVDDANQTVAGWKEDKRIADRYGAEYERYDLTTSQAKYFYEGDAKGKVTLSEYAKQLESYGMDRVKAYYGADGWRQTGLSMEQYNSYATEAAKCKGVDSDGDGKADANSVKSQKLQVINSLPVSSSVKDAIYRKNGWSESGLKNTPWH
ncbi:MAG: hypothetical protein IJV51_04305 [Oscillospiraceae bacterium]|nr:hypothetical protein [Oscillospiraceae bacterium]